LNDSIHKGSSLNLKYQESLNDFQGKIGPRKIPGWELHDVDDRGNCFYDAVVHQMGIIDHSFLKGVSEGTLPRDSLRLRLQGENFKDEEWADDRQFHKLVKEFDVTLAIIDTRGPENGYIYYYLGDNREVITHVPDNNS